jgi:hypothetical protein
MIKQAREDIRSIERKFKVLGFPPLVELEIIFSLVSEKEGQDEYKGEGI